MNILVEAARIFEGVAGQQTIHRNH